MGLDEALERQCNWWCAAYGGKYNWKDPNTVLVIAGQLEPQRGKSFSSHAPPQGARENLVCALKLLANQQTGGDSLVDTLFEGLQEQSGLKIMDELMEVDSQEAVKIGVTR